MDNRFERGEGIEAFTGNELLLKGGLEGGMNLLTGYPGSPVADIFDCATYIAPYLKQRGILAQLANNEAMAAARVNGSQLQDLRVMAVWKSVGFHVAADGLATGNLGKTGHKGGAVAVVGDDPWTDSTQVPADSRRLSDHLLMPVLEPSTFQEVKDWVKLAFELSAAADLYVTYLITTNQADGGATVALAPNLDRPGVPTTINRATLDTQAIDTTHSILLPPYTAALEREALTVKWPALLAAARSMGLNRLEPGRTGAKLGFVASGLSYAYLIQALRECGVEGEYPVLKLGMSYPVDPEALAALFDRCGRVVVVEEKRGFIEAQVRSLAVELRQSGRLGFAPEVWGKSFPDGLEGLPMAHGLNTSVVIKRLAPLFDRLGLGTEASRSALALIQRVENSPVRVPARTPTFCPGCPHRDSASVFLELKHDLRDADYMRREHGTGPMDVIFHGDAGCYSMLYFPPNVGLMHNYSGMGMGGGTGAGLTPFTTNKSVAFIGDSTFFHSGLSAVSDAIKNGQDILFVVLNNRTTAMTGHQPHPGSERDLMDNLTLAQDPARALRGLAYGRDIPVVRVNPERRREYRAALEDLIMLPGVKFVVSDKECGITYHRRRRRERSRTLAEKGYLPREIKVNVANEACEYCQECARLTGCPGLTVENTPFGPKMATDLSTCVSDKACARIKVCPSFEELDIRRVKPASKPAIPAPVDLPAPKRLEVDGEWRAYLAGIGGMGIGSVTTVIILAGKKAGYHVNFCDKKGLAIRNGGVYSHITFTRDDRVVSPVTPYGKADLMLGLDILEAARGLDPNMNLRVGSPDRTDCLVSTSKNQTIQSLMGLSHFDPLTLEKDLRANSRTYWGHDMAPLSQRYLGHTLYVNVMMLGVAFQRGLLPVDLSHITDALAESFRPEEAKRNLDAFTLGRDVVVHPERYLPEPPETMEQAVARKATHLSKAEARAFRDLIADALMRLALPEPMRLALALRLAELVVWGGAPYAKRYLDIVAKVHALDRKDRGWAATEAVLKQGFRVMAIKDEIYVAHLLTSPEKYELDAQRFGVDLKAGDRIVYKHINRPTFELFGLKIAFDINTRDWMLNIMKRLRFLRDFMPGWHQKEADFREWYLELAGRYERCDNDAVYDLWVELLALPKEVRGYTAVRYPKQDEAHRKAEALLARLAEFKEKGTGVLAGIGGK